VGVQVRGGTRPLRTRPQQRSPPGSEVVPGAATCGGLSIWRASAMIWPTRHRHATRGGNCLPTVSGGNLHSNHTPHTRPAKRACGSLAADLR
jgi:hypothetical protein